MLFKRFVYSMIEDFPDRNLLNYHSAGMADLLEDLGENKYAEWMRDLESLRFRTLISIIEKFGDRGDRKWFSTLKRRVFREKRKSVVCNQRGMQHSLNMAVRKSKLLQFSEFFKAGKRLLAID